ncbi:MAG: SDR family NAD(P)-dependent oxidoreductase, partial [Acidobacteriaceae bacterium]|nr:SDR family NAD(P)-dependent oxidoreductase [Acidobacteriaceae bacterium]
MLAARQLAETGAANLMLTGRSQADENLTRMMNILRDLGTKVIYCPADLTAESDVSRLIAETRKQFGAIEGWLHAAGISRAARLPHKTTSDVTAVLGPKVTGTLLLDRELRKEPLQRIILFSSIAGVLGDFGQTDYAFANAFLDAFAEQHKSHTVSIRWPLCSGGHMQMNEANQEYLRRNFGMQPLPDGVFRQVLSQALTSDTFHLLPLYGEIQLLRRLFNLSVQVPDQKEAELMQTEYSVETALVEAVRDVTQLAATQIDLASDLREYGLDSIGYTELANKLNTRFGVSLTPTLFFESANLQAVADAVRRKLSQPNEILKPAARIPATATIKPVQHPSVTLPKIVQDNGIAIIGMAGRFPGAETPEEFWAQLVAGADLIAEIPPERRALAGNETSDSETVSRWGGFIADVDGFDASLFGISPREAALMDPQQRLFLETAWATIEDAGYRPSSLAGTATGVFVGVANMDYANLMAREGTPVETHATTGVSHAILANRVSYLFDLRGPSEPIDTACSSSLIAVHRAIEAIHSGSCDQAIAGGVNVLLSEELFISFSKAGMLSSSGRCRTFDASADGYVRGEGVGAVFLKPLSKAIADGDQVLAVIRASGESHNGRANGLTAPNGEGQKSLLVRTYSKGGIDPTSVTYVEAHGTATQLGDPVECNALRNAFEHLVQERQEQLPATAFCGLGSVKSNIGHLETAAGIAGLQKVILALQHKYLPPTLHVQQTNPYLQLADGPLYLVTKGRDWHTREGQRRRAGISSFGFGGANAHLVVEEAPEFSNEHEFPVRSVFVLSGRTAEQLQTVAERLLAHIKADFPTDHLARLAFTLQTGRDAYAHRLAIVAQSRDELAASLQAFRSGQTNTENVVSGMADETSSATLLLLSGPEGRDFIQALLRNQKPVQLARLWVAGA